MNVEYLFKIKTLEAGQRGPYQDSFYTYEVTSIESEHDIKQFCMNVLKPSYFKKDMPNPFAGELLEFTQLTDNNKGKSFLNSKDEETYFYRVRCIYTG